MESPEVPDEGLCSPASTRNTRSTVRSRIWESLLAIITLIWSCTGSAASGIWETGSTVACTIAKACLAVASGIWKIGSTVAFMIAYLIWKAGTFVAVKWERAFVLSCIAVSLDPLFLYIPIVDETNKCLNMDKTLRTTALVLRTLTDFLLLTHIIAEICQRIHEQTDDYLSTDDNLSTDDYLSTDKYLSTDYPKYLSEDSNRHSDKEFDPDPKESRMYPLKSFIKHQLPWLTPSLIIKLLAIVPVPQVAILVGFFKMTGSDFYVMRKLLNVALVLQYLPRICQIYLTKEQFRMGGKWPQPLFNLYLYILAGHALGSLWYFVAIERETSCWHKACKKIPGCVATSTYNCGGNTSTKNITFLNQLCPINSPNSTLFDFGIFVHILQSGNTQSDKFATKLFYSLWWGLKNLSNFGTNLETSNYLWENCFAILICVIGLLLFLYLIGNVQLYIQSAPENSLKKENSRKKKIDDTHKSITEWMKDRFQGVDVIRKRIKREIREDKVVEKNLVHDVDVKYFLKPPRIRKSVLEHVGVKALKKVPMLQALGDAKLKSLSQLMKPVVRGLDSHFVKRGDQLHQMLFVIEGAIFDVENPNDLVSEDDYYGREILQWVSFNYTRRSYCETLPRSIGLLKSCGERKLEALALDAWDLLKFLEEDKFDINNPEAKELADEYGSKHKEISSMPPSSPATPSTPTADPPDGPWNPPAPGSVKLNCSYVWDASTKKACFGCVLRNDKGEIIAAGGVGSYQCIDSFEAGALSISYCLKNPLKPVKTSHQIVVESDDKLFIDLLIDLLKKLPLHNDPRVRGILRPTLQNIANVVSKFKGHKFVSCNCQANEAALLVAEHARASGSTDWKNAEEIKGLFNALKKYSPRPEENQDLAQKVNGSRATTSADAALEEIRIT